MSQRKALIFLGIIMAWAAFVAGHAWWNHANMETRIRKYALFVADEMWYMDADKAREDLYMMLSADGVDSAEMRHRNGDLFVRVKPAAQQFDALGLMLKKFHLIWSSSVSVPVSYNGEGLGLLEVSWPDTSIYLYANAALLALALWLILRYGEVLRERNRSLAEAMSALRESQERLRQGEKMEAVGQLAGGIAHDFNNQLTVIMGFADMLLEDVKEPQQIEFAERIRKTASRSADLIKKLLAFARKGHAAQAPVDIHKLMADTVDMLEHSIDKRIIISQNLMAGRATVLGDANQLQNAFLNLSFNARDAMPGGGSLTFETSNLPANQDDGLCASLGLPQADYLIVRVRDSGTGMPPEVKRHIFEPFFTTKPVGKGTGMGLAAVFGTVKGHNGAVSVESEEDNGTTFSIFLPLTNQVPCLANEGAQPAKTIADNLGIMVIDDEDPVRACFASMLESAGHYVLAAATAREGLELYRHGWGDIDLVMLDLMMPGMSGKECFKRLREVNPKAKVMIVSGFSSNDDAKALLDGGAIGFLQKPFDRDRLLQAVTEAMGKVC